MKCLVEDTVGANDDELLRVMASLNAKYANVVATQAARAETAVSLLKELAEDPRDRWFGMLLGRHSARMREAYGDCRVQVVPVLQTGPGYSI